MTTGGEPHDIIIIICTGDVKESMKYSIKYKMRNVYRLVESQHIRDAVEISSEISKPLFFFCVFIWVWLNKRDERETKSQRYNRFSMGLI